MHGVYETATFNTGVQYSATPNAVPLTVFITFCISATERIRNRGENYDFVWKHVHSEGQRLKFLL